MANSVIENIRITCGLCGLSDDYIWSEIEIHTQSDECDLCGSHGNTEVSFFCKQCEKYSDIEVRSW